MSVVDRGCCVDAVRDQLPTRRENRLFVSAGWLLKSAEVGTSFIIPIFSATGRFVGRGNGEHCNGWGAQGGATLGVTLSQCRRSLF